MTWQCPHCERRYPDSALGLPEGNEAYEKTHCKTCHGRKLAWEAWKEAANRNGSMSQLTNLEERTQRRMFEQWWDGL